jgi:hypothetical protein|tara:strand:- start:145 stop:882 length:738 start_codon:yes stop_codon:yes gene_type:complete
MDGIELCSRYSFITNKLKLCGPEDSYKILLDYIFGKEKDKEKVKNLLKKFEGLYPYLEAIGNKHGLDPFSYEVVEAYWQGNELLDTFTKDDMAKLINELVKRGLLRSLADKLIERLPEDPIPYHMFHAMFVGVGSVTGSVETNVENMDKCRATWANVKKAEDKIILDWMQLKIEDNEFRLVTVDNWANVYQLDYDKRLVPVADNDFVALHWNYPVKKLEYKEMCNLRKYTHKVIRIMNSIKSSMH